jgi:hypothetical protein
MVQYADIQALTIIPGVAAEGEIVNVNVRIRNLYTAVISIAISGLFYYDSMAKDINFPTPSMNISPGGDGYFYGSFLMPNKSGTVWVRSWWYGADGQWHGDDEETGSVTLLVKEYSGTITDKWINKAPEGNRIPIPAQVVADGNTFEVGVKYKNLSGKTVTVGPRVEVWDPDDPQHAGAPRVSPAVDWTGMSHGEELSTEYNICRVDKPGNWLIRIDLLMNRDNPVVVDTWFGLLFYASEEAPPPEFSEFQISSFSKV